jgi:SAM-dependent methyltransferase
MTADESTDEAPQRGSIERFDPATHAGGMTHAEHVARYRLACALAPGRDVLDAACGAGYGTRMLSEAGAKSALGIDIAAEALPGQVSEKGTLSYAVGDLRELPLDDASVDLVVCFEAIEHVAEQDKVFDEFRRVLRPGGLVVVSSPNPASYPPGNPHHVHELSPGELRDALAARWANVGLLYQDLWLFSSVEPAETLEQREGLSYPGGLGRVSGPAPDEAIYAIGIASDGEMPDLDPVAYIGGGVDITSWIDKVTRFDAVEQELRDALQQIKELELDRGKLRERAGALEFDVEYLQGERDHLNRALELVYSSKSWRLTAPLRRFRGH